MTSIRINNVNDLMNIVYAAMKKFGGQHLWWRGQAHSSWDLRPPLYQKGYASNEHKLAHLFLNKAKVRYAKCPDPNDHRSWLLLMHHYGLPTRLLNWSESVDRVCGTAGDDDILSPLVFSSPLGRLVPTFTSFDCVDGLEGDDILEGHVLIWH